MKTSSVPSGRWSRLARLGSLAGGVAGGMLAEGARQLAQGKRPRVSDLLLTPSNARRVTDQLAQMRGAAMKLGQLLSMDAGDLLPPELGEILARLRSDAKAMPMSQLVTVLDAGWGKGWDRHFRQFSFTPVAAASIGQVHLAHTTDGRHLAIKVQYPGVRDSIDSDIDNVASLLRISGLLPKSLDIKPLLQDAKRQLHAEADYLLEGAYLGQYGVLLASTPDSPHSTDSANSINSTDYLVPRLHADLTTSNILAMTCLGGVAVESLLPAAQAERNRVLELLFTLLFREIFEFRLIQTDPNFANYRYDTDSRQLILLDFGATRVYPATIIDAYGRLMQGAIAGDRPAMCQAAGDIGYFQGPIQGKHQQAVLDIFMLASEPLRHNGEYDFGTSDLAARIRDSGLELARDGDFWHTPPADALFLHRKLGGLFLLAVRLKARVNVHALAKRFVVR